MVFRKKAFNHFDTFFCVGPHHNIEIKETEKIYKLNKIQTFNFGYYKIDKLLSKKRIIKDKTYINKKIVIIAPSWGKNCILESLAMNY